MHRTSRTPVALGLSAVGLAVLGLAVLLYGTYLGVQHTHALLQDLHPLPADARETLLTAAALETMLPATLLVAGLLACAGLVLAGRDAGRAALVWLSGVGSVVTLVLYVNRGRLLGSWDFVVRIGLPAWVGVLGVLVAMIALAGAAVSLGVPAARQAFAATGSDQAGIGQAGRTGPPAPLRAAVSRFAVGGVLGLAGPVFTIGDSLPDVDLTDVVSAPGLIFLAGAGAIAVAATGACCAAWAAGRGRPDGANIARIAGLLLLLLQALSLYWATRTIATGVRYSLFLDSDLKLIGTLMLVTVVAGIAATLGGFAGLADPRSERFLRPVSRPTHQGRHSWTSADPRPADNPTPADDYTVS
ncbi:hypothetical protein Daura_46405 [Dactylosporangium aurantiacum]|uniref:Uncharacterized protein n=1 Tax=Dactylosporangium aurantiacum TaxID=35754 RepID=A0A9Q9II82_9ACTN|nr:hypothetical protein [Dactylosporangium aurantiacum]MDG6108151.1 hypothetical protein [Dactylosporangium aurantiacum]UWZ53854.1 hypothetical protein Daura_46405 [Dactylosporangium aurantiacum]